MGKTALVLGGGGSRGAYEVGVWRALRELDIKIDMVMGTSVGSINGAMIAQDDLELAQKLWYQLETDMIFDVETTGVPTEDALAYAKEIVTNGGAGTSGLQDLLSSYLDEDKIRASKIEYGLVTTEFPSMEGKYLYIEDIPKGKLPDFILASSSCFPAVQKCIIDDKKYIDGAYSDNLPVEMAIKKAATAIIAVDVHGVGVMRKNSIKNAKENTEEFHMLESPVDLGNFLIFDKDNTSRIMELGYLETMRYFGRYDGKKYTFKKGVFNKHQLAGADNAAYYLWLDPCVVYDNENLIPAIKAQLSAFSDTDIHLHGNLVLLIARSLKEDEVDSPFLKSGIFKLLTGEIQAANFLVKNNLI